MTDTTTAQPFPAHNVVAAFDDVEGARRAVESLKQAGVPDDQLSLLGRPSEDLFGNKAGLGAGDVDQSTEELQELEDEVVATGAKTAAGGAVAGGLLGVLAGAAMVAIPGIGTVVGAGVLAAIGAGVGATGGAVVGGVLGAGSKMNEEYRQDIESGRVLVGVHTADPGIADKAAQALQQVDAKRLDRFGPTGPGAA